MRINITCTYVDADPINAADPSGTDRVTCNVTVAESGNFSGSCTFTADDSGSTDVTYNITREYTDAYGREQTTTESISQSFEGSISQEGFISKVVFAVGEKIQASIERNLSTLVGSEVQLSAGQSGDTGPRGTGRVGADSYAGSGGSLRNLGNLQNRANERAADVARSRGASGSNIREMGPWANKSLREVSEAARAGDRSAAKALKIVKEADRLGKKY